MVYVYDSRAQRSVNTYNGVDGVLIGKHFAPDVHEDGGEDAEVALHPSCRLRVCQTVLHRPEEALQYRLID